MYRYLRAGKRHLRLPVLPTQQQFARLAQAVQEAQAAADGAEASFNTLRQQLAGAYTAELFESLRTAQEDMETKKAELAAAKSARDEVWSWVQVNGIQMICTAAAN